MANIINPEEFHIGITMAGAVSAGCYTAGVMDYMFEILQLWEDAKNELPLPNGFHSDIKNLIPKHKVIIDVMGGASAGGMTTVMSAIYALKGKIKPVIEPVETEKPKGNMLYDNWVLMGDVEGESLKLIEKILKTDDLNSGKIESLLNSKFIDNICDNAFIDDVTIKKKPNYISDELEILLSHTMLKSVPLSIDFITPFGRLRTGVDSPKYNSYEHLIISHFKLNYDSLIHKDCYFPLDPFKNKSDIDRLKLVTKATGAFPIGLTPRSFTENDFSKEYIINNAKKLIFNTMNVSKFPINPDLKFANPQEPFNFLTVDGGAINNEPFGEVLNILKERYGEKKKEDYDKFGLIMIDPFPDTMLYDNKESPTDILGQIPAIINTLQQQAKIKRREMLELSTNNYFISEIFPVRYCCDDYDLKYKRNEKYENPISCGAAFAFGGFLDVNFRHHDFFLGRDNARNFFHVYFSFEYDPKNDSIHPIHKNWSADMINAFKFTRKDNSGVEKIFLPIIPDLNILNYKKNNQIKNPFSRTVKEWPKFDPNNLINLSNKIDNRVELMIDIILMKNDSIKVTTKHSKTDGIIDKKYNNGFFRKIGNRFGNAFKNIVVNLGKGSIKTKITKETIRWILEDLEDKNLLK